MAYLDYCKFDTTEKYIGFLEKLNTYCDTVALINPDEGSPGFTFIEEIKPYLIRADWTRRFPGYGRSGNLKVLYFTISNGVHSAFKKYDSFLSVGYDLETDEGLDMAFYRKKDLVFNVLSHENMCNLSSKHEIHFREIIEQFNIGMI